MSVSVPVLPSQHLCETGMDRINEVLSGKGINDSVLLLRAWYCESFVLVSVTNQTDEVKSPPPPKKVTGTRTERTTGLTKTK